MKQSERETFQNTVWAYYEASGRHDLPWRIPEPDGTYDPYKIMVSEIMLQQTQVTRVIPKYLAFLDTFPTVNSLAASSLGDVLKQWSGLGYNRRAKFLWQAAQLIVAEYKGIFPNSETELVKLPGVGKNTAAAILAYTWNEPVTFIETNIRTVFIHHFCADQPSVTDLEILALVEQTVPTESRLWYWALMDYGTHLKSEVGNLNKLSKSYTKQSSFHGSKRQVRGAVIRLLTARPSLTLAQISEYVSDDRLELVLEDLSAEAMIVQTVEGYMLQ